MKFNQDRDKAFINNLHFSKGNLFFFFFSPYHFIFFFGKNNMKLLTISAVLAVCAHMAVASKYMKKVL